MTTTRYMICLVVALVGLWLLPGAGVNEWVVRVVALFAFTYALGGLLISRAS